MACVFAALGERGIALSTRGVHDAYACFSHRKIRAIWDSWNSTWHGHAIACLPSCVWRRWDTGVQARIGGHTSVCMCVMEPTAQLSGVD